MRIIKSQDMGMGGMPPMGGMDMAGMGGMPPMPAPDPPGPPQVLKPINTIGELLMDVDVEEIIASNPTATDEEIANIIWREYGGNRNGSVDRDKVGERTNSRPIDSMELDATENEKWKRLESGKTIADIIDLGEIEEFVSSLKYSVLKKINTPEAPPGGGMPMASTYKDKMIKMAQATYIINTDEAIKDFFKKYC